MFTRSKGFQVIKEWKNSDGKTVKHCKKGEHEIIVTFENEPSKEAIKQFNILFNKYGYDYAS